MGAAMSCPSDFEKGTGFTCRMKCPSEFKYAQEGGETSELVEKCVYAQNNEYAIPLRQMPMLENKDQEPPQYAQERKRFSEELKILKDKIFAEAPTQTKIQSLKTQYDNDTRQYSTIQSQYASYSAAGEVADTIQQATERIREIRPPLAGSRDIELEKRRLLETSQPNMLLIQVAIAVTVLCLLVYLLVPTPYAHPIVFLLLSMGIAVGIFLKK